MILYSIITDFTFCYVYCTEYNEDNTNNSFGQGSNGLMGNKRPLPSKSSYSISAGGGARGERQAATIMLQDQVDESMQLKAGTLQYSTVQYSTVQYSTVQYSTVQYSTVQYSTV